MSPRGNRDQAEQATDATPDATPDTPAVLDGTTASPASTEPQLCGVMVTKRNKEGVAQKYAEGDDIPEGKNVGDEIQAPCIKAKGHDPAKSKHSWRAYTKVDTSVITLDDVATFDAVPTDEVVESVREQEDSEVQKMINEQVVAAYLAWVNAGKPKNWGEAIRKGVVAKYRVTPENEAAWRSMLRIAASRSADRSDVPQISVKAHPKLKKMTDGTTQLWFYAVEHKSRQSGESAETLEATATGV